MSRRNAGEDDDLIEGVDQLDDDADDDLHNDLDDEPDELEDEEPDDASEVDEDSDDGNEDGDDSEDDGNEDDESLVAISRRSVPRRSLEDQDDRDEDEELDFASQPLDAVAGELRTRVDPMTDTREFVCARCHLVKSRSQLADASRLLCRDCV